MKHLAFVLALAFSIVFLTACSEKKPIFHNTDITGADYAQDFALPDPTGRVRRLADFAGKVVVVFFGYTQCPDVCPTTLTELVQVKKILNAKNQPGDKLVAVFITLDPERDTSEVLSAYMNNFDPAFVALRPSLKQLPEITQQFHVYAQKIAGPTKSSYALDHSAGSYIFDSHGRLRLYHRYGGNAQELAADVAQLMK